MYDDLLLPFDGSDGAVAVCRHVGEIARHVDATVHVLFVADTTRDSVTVIEGQPVDALVRKGDDVVTDAAATLSDLGVDHRTEVVQGNPAPTIIEYAENTGHDLIVMPTHGREGISRYLLGSVSEKVVRLSSVPVLTARMRPDERLAFPYEDVLVPTDGSGGATRAIEHGLSLAAALDATVHALAVVEDAPPLPTEPAVDAAGDADRAATAALDDVESTAAEYGLTGVERHVERGDPAAGILDYVDANDVDAVVMGTTGRRGTERVLLGSVAEKTVRSAPVPVVTVANPE